MFYETALVLGNYSAWINVKQTCGQSLEFFLKSCIDPEQKKTMVGNTRLGNLSFSSRLIEFFWIIGPQFYWQLVLLYTDILKCQKMFQNKITI